MNGRTKRRFGLSLVLALGLSLPALALAKHIMVSPGLMKVKLFRNKIHSQTSNLSAAGSFLSLRNTPILFTCPSGYTIYRNVNVSTPRDNQRIRVMGAGRTKAVNIPSLKLATRGELVRACLAGKTRYSTQIDAQAHCYKSSNLAYQSDHKMVGNRVPVTLELECKEIIPPNEDFASVQIKTYRHDCPSGYMLPNRQTSTVISSSQAQKCILR